jgi:hypothetical protein
MPTINTGFTRLNDFARTPTQSEAFCVLGLPRGGTTMTARLVEAAGVFIGDNLPVTAEDPEFVRILKEVRPDHQAFREAVAKREVAHRLWGFKAPFRNHWDLLETLNNVRFIAVFRDLFAVANRNHISVDADITASMAANGSLCQEIIRFVGKTRHPVFLFSYEKALLSPAALSKALAEFIGNEATEETLAKMTAIIQPNEARYVSAHDPAAVKTSIHIDILEPERLVGWARKSNGLSVALIFEVNGTAVREAIADLRRPDLAERFGNEGRYAFDVKFPEGVVLSEGDKLVIRNKATNEPLFAKMWKD